MNKVFIFTEGSIKVGFGHVARCTALYQAFLEHKITPTFVVNGDQTIQNFTKEINIKLINWRDNLDNLVSTIQWHDIVIVDSYLANFNDYKKLSDVSGILVCLDDTNRLNYPADIVINGAIDAHALDYQTSSYIEYLLGSKYQPLRKAFWKSSPKMINERIKSIVITMGGNDMRNLTPKILNSLCHSTPELIKHVIVGKAFTNIDEVIKASDSNTELHKNLNDRGMQKLMKNADIAISASGQTLQELAVMGVPTIGIIVADNQEIIAKSWIKSGFLILAGRWDNRNLVSNISRSLGELSDQDVRLKRSRYGSTLMNGDGCRRIVQHLLNKAKKK